MRSAFAWALFAIGPVKVSYWSAVPGEHIKVMISGGNGDWETAREQTNTRAEALHSLAVLIHFKGQFHILHGIDYTQVIA